LLAFRIPSVRGGGIEPHMVRAHLMAPTNQINRFRLLPKRAAVTYYCSTVALSATVEVISAAHLKYYYEYAKLNIKKLRFSTMCGPSCFFVFVFYK
jgi:hypothetical protein